MTSFTHFEGYKKKNPFASGTWGISEYIHQNDIYNPMDSPHAHRSAD
jgi:hypothetical protein